MKRMLSFVTAMALAMFCAVVFAAPVIPMEPAPAAVFAQPDAAALQLLAVHSAVFKVASANHDSALGITISPHRQPVGVPADAVSGAITAVSLHLVGLHADREAKTRWCSLPL